MKRSFGCVVLAMVVSGCGASKEPAYFALAPQPAAAQAGGPGLIELRRPSVPGYLDRADIVKKVKDYQLHLDTAERWAEPLGDMVGRVIAQDLSSRLAPSQVFVENGAIAAIPDVIVAVDVQTFDAGADGAVTLIAQVTAESQGTQRTTRARRFDLHVQPDGGGTTSLVAAMSQLLGQLSDGIAAMLREH